jgi:hypothetical protein
MTIGLGENSECRIQDAELKSDFTLYFVLNSEF